MNISADNDTSDAENVRRNVCGGFVDLFIERHCRTSMSFRDSPHVRRGSHHAFHDVLKLRDVRSSYDRRA